MSIPALAVTLWPEPSTIEDEITGLRAAQQRGEHGAALARARARLADYPGNRDLLLIEASALRHLRRIEEALAALDRLEAVQPGFSLLHQERGLCHVARRDAPAAIAALLAAVNINPALPHTWHMLEGLWRLTGEPDNASTAAAHVATLKALPSPVVRATALFADGEVTAAEHLVRGFLLAHGDHPEAMRLLARIGVRQGVLDDAELLYAGVLALEPDHHAARLEYVQTLIARHSFAAAGVALAPLLAREPRLHSYRIAAATIAVGLGQHAPAIAIYRDLLAELAPELGIEHADTTARHAAADLNLWLGHALKTIGELGPAIDAYHAAAALRPAFGDAWWSLANLKTYRFDEAAVAAMRAAEEAPATAPADRVHLGFARAKALEDAGNFERAWAHYARGNALKREASRYRPEVIETNTRLQRHVCTPAFFAARRGWGLVKDDPIFVVGLPRSGSTLIEQILASHPEVEGTQELPDIQRIVLDLNGREPDLDNPRYPGALGELTEADTRALGERYLTQTRAYRTQGKPRFIDKMPNNFRHIGLIHLILPNATIVDARREPMACCFSNLKQLFAQGQEFAYSVDDIARYYRTYLDLMRHWDDALAAAELPGRVLRMIHEDVIDDLDGQVRRLLAHCRLDFDPACLSFHKTERAVRTPSSEQVRRPIFRDGLEQWRHFEPWLGDLRAALGDAVDNWRD